MTIKETFMKNSLLPKRYYNEISLRPAKVDEKAFEELNEFKVNALQHVKEGDNLLICSNNVGNGKTSWSSKILKEYINQLGNVMIDKMTPAVFINVTNFLNEKKLSINNYELQAKVADTESKIMSAKLVVFDDLGVKDLSPYDMGNLYYWIDYRTSNMKSSIYTSNLLPNQLKKVLDERIYSRIVNYSKVIEIKDGDSRRGAK